MQTSTTFRALQSPRKVSLPSLIPRGRGSQKAGGRGDGQGSKSQRQGQRAQDAALASGCPRWRRVPAAIVRGGSLSRGALGQMSTRG